MRVLMLGTPTCQTCKRVRPVIEEHCNEQGIEFEYLDITGEIPQSVRDTISEKGLRHAPSFLIYRKNEEVVAVSGDDIFLELKN